MCLRRFLMKGSICFAGVFLLLIAQVNVNAAGKEYVACWDFARVTGNLVKDLSGNGNDAIIHGATLKEEKGAKALSFDGVDDYLEAPSIDITNSFTIEAWIYANSLAGNPMILSKEWNTAYYLQVLAGGRIQFGGRGDSKAKSNSGEITPDCWYQITGTFNTSTHTIIIYKNGVEIAKTTDAVGVGTNSKKVIIGARNSLAGQFFNGLISKITIYNTALSADEIKASYESQAGSYASVDVPVLRGTQYAVLYPQKGEMVTVNIISIPVGTYKDNLFYSILAPGAKRIKKGLILLDEEKDVSFTATKPGAYVLVLESGANICKFTCSVPSAISPTSNTPLHIFKYSPTLYFYVPERVKKFTVYVQAVSVGEGADIRILSPDGKIITRQSGEFDTLTPLEVKVPEGMDEKTWAIEIKKPDSGVLEDVALHLSKNLPPYVAKSKKELSVIVSFSKKSRL